MLSRIGDFFQVPSPSLNEKSSSYAYLTHEVSDYSVKVGVLEPKSFLSCAEGPEIFSSSRDNV